MNGELIEKYFKTVNSKLKFCLYPQFCGNKAIKAHSIQNSKVLELIEEDGHVIGLNSRNFKDKEPEIFFGSISRNNASTFTGLCSYHDNQVFKDIDTKLDSDSQKHLFLITYRSVLKELYAQLDRAVKSQHLVSDVNQLTEKQFKTIMANWLCYRDTNDYKEKLDNILQRQNYQDIQHIKYIIKHLKPSVTVSQMFSADSISFNGSVLTINLNIIPLDLEHSLVLFSFFPEERSLVEDYIQKCLTVTDDLKNYETSKMIIRNCENFFLRPSYYKNWNSNKEFEILKYFKESMNKDFEKESEYFMLFD